MTALESTAGCVAPDELARRVQALLDRSGWAGWSTWIRLDVDGHRVMVFGGRRQ